MLPKRGLCLKKWVAVKSVRKKGASMYFGSETREQNMAEKIQLWIIKVQVKGKVIPLQNRCGPEGG